MPRVAALCFDLFDTLVDLRMEHLPRLVHGGPEEDRPARPSTARALHEAVCERTQIAYEAFARALGEVDRTLREPRYREGRELPTLERFVRLAELLALDAPDLPDRLTEIHMGLLVRQVEVPEHHAAVLGALRERVPLAVCSNFSHTPTAERVLRETGLLDRFDAVVVSETLGIRKPRREIFDAVAQALGLAPAEILHVGDRLEADVAGAAAAGMQTAWLTRRVSDPEAALRAYEGPPPDIVVKDVRELAPVVGGGSDT